MCQHPMWYKLSNVFLRCLSVHGGAGLVCLVPGPFGWVGWAEVGTRGQELYPGEGAGIPEGGDGWVCIPPRHMTWDTHPHRTDT